MAQQVKSTRQQAIQVTDSFLKNLTPQKAHTMFVEKNGADVNKLNVWLWGMFPELGGWYYDNECTEFCFNKIRRAIVSEACKYCSSKQEVAA